MVNKTLGKGEILVTFLELHNTCFTRNILKRKSIALLVLKIKGLNVQLEQ
jgi:hypothetical protein